MFQPHVTSNPLSDAFLTILRSWSSSCDAEHDQCPSNKQVALPSRLVGLSSMPSSAEIASVTHQRDTWAELFGETKCTLVENMPGTMGKYASLSYCWGSSLPYTTTVENLDQNRQGIQFNDLPRTLQDAIMIARYIGFDYIWIDCLCIVQNDKADWAREASRMADIYSNADLSIAASRAAHCDEGFLHSRRLAPWTRASFEDPEGSFDLFFVYDFAYTEREQEFYEQNGLLFVSLVESSA
jgi:hypothetical protein